MQLPTLLSTSILLIGTRVRAQLVASGLATASLPPPAITESVAGAQGTMNGTIAVLPATSSRTSGLVATGATPATALPPTITESVAGQDAVGATTSLTLQGLGDNATSTAVGTTIPVAGGIGVWVVSVGSSTNELVFSPDTVMAQPGDMVQFQFYAQNHSVASASFAQPCVPQAQSDPSAAVNSFWSGFMPTDAQGQLTYTVPVRDSNPIWFYCSQAKHCQSGMVGVINPPATGQTLDQFKVAAAKAPENVSPNSNANNSSGGQIGGTTSISASATAATALKSVASKNVVETSFLGLLVAALLLLSMKS